MQYFNTQEQPEFLVKSTQGVALTSAIILTPFTINNFIQGRYLLGVLTLLTFSLCAISAWLCYHGKYHLKINLFGIAPSIMAAIATALISLGIVGSYWPALGIIAFYFILPKRPAWLANLIFIGIITPIAWTILDPAVAMRFFAVLLGISFFAFISAHEVYKQYHQLNKQAITDKLTGLQNRFLLQSSLEKAINQSYRTNTPMAILMLDIDHFKIINDQFGHHTGDLVLKKTGDFLSKSFRSSDIVFRIGGEEFLVLIYNTDKKDAHRIAEELRGEFEKHALIDHQSVTISIGVSSLQPDMSWEQWMKESDKNMYQAKENGRNQVVA